MSYRAFSVLLLAACASPPGVEPCEPEEDVALCAAAGRSCGSAELVDACGDTVRVECGSCGDGEACSPIGQCIDASCAPEDDASFCAREGFACGAHEGIDDCRQDRTFACGDCEDGRACSAVGQCIDPTCTPESDAELCARAGVTCGEHRGLDNCEQTRTADCGEPCASSGAPGWFGEFEVHDPIYGPSLQSHRMLTVDVGTHYVVVWQDGRSDGSGWSISDAVLSSRVTYAGDVLDPGGVMLGEPGTNQSIDALVFDGTDVVLVLHEYVEMDVDRLMLRRLGVDGRPLDAAPVDVVSESVYGATAAFDGTSIVLAWVGGPVYGEEVKVARVTPGTLALGATHVLSSPDTFASHLSLAVFDGRSMLAWLEGSATTHTMRTSLLVADSAPGEAVALEDALGPLLVNSYAQPHWLFATPEGFALIHEHRDTAGEQRRLHAQFFDATGTPIAGAPLLLHERSEPAGSISGGTSYFARAGALGDDWLVTFQNERQVEGMVVDAATRSVSIAPRVLADTDRGGSQFACHTRECTLIGMQGSGSFQQTRFQRYDASLEHLGSHDAATAAAFQNAPTAAFDGTQFLVLFMERPSSVFLDEERLLARRLSTDGEWLDAAPIEVPLTDALRYSSGAASYPGGGFLVRWMEDDPSFNERFYVRRMRADGTWAWPTAVRIEAYATTSPSYGESACAADVCIVTLTRDWDRWEYVLVDGTGTVGAVTPLADFTNDRVAPAVRYDGAGAFELAFIQDHAIHVRTVAVTGGPGAVSFDVPADADVSRIGPRWHRHGAEVLLLSSASAPDGSEDGFHYFVEARTWSGTSLSAPFVVADELVPAHQLVGAVSDGGALDVFVLAFSPLFFPTGAREQLYRARYESGAGITEAASPYFDAAWFGPATVVPGGARGLLLYERIDWDVGFGDDRVRLSFVGDRASLLADDAACTDDGQCESGRCRAGLCCDECSLWKGL